jgi:hypothetical protein
MTACDCCGFDGEDMELKPIPSDHGTTWMCSDCLDRMERYEDENAEGIRESEQLQEMEDFHRNEMDI